MKPAPGGAEKAPSGARHLACSAIVALLAAGCSSRSAPSPGDSATPPGAGGPSAATATGASPSSSASSIVSAAPSPPPPPVPLSTAVPCGAKAPPPWPRTNPDLGQWGEELRTAPDFGYEQERRAPKMPDAGSYLARTPARTAPKLEDALLICHVEVYTRDGDRPAFYRYKLARPDAGRPRCLGDWDFFAPPDVLLHFRLRGEHPIALFGPEDHWGFFISVPRVRLAAGDLLEVKLFDRDSAGDRAGASEDGADYIGYASTTLTGRWPVRLHGPYFTMACNAMSSDQALASARRWLGALDGTLNTLAARRPDPRQWDFGGPGSWVERGESSFGEGNFRYAAGFLGWNHPAILERRARVKQITEVDWPRKRAEAARRLAKSAPPPGKAMPLGGRRGTLRATGVVCQGSSCTVTLEISGASGPGLSADSKVAAAGIDAEGIFHGASLVLEEEAEAAPGGGAATGGSAAPGGGAATGKGAPAAKARSFRVELPASALVLWISSPAGVHTVKVREPE